MTFIGGDGKEEDEEEKRFLHRPSSVAPLTPFAEHGLARVKPHDRPIFIKY